METDWQNDSRGTGAVDQIDFPRDDKFLTHLIVSAAHRLFTRRPGHRVIGDGWRRENFDQISKLGKGKKVSGNFIVDLWLSFNPIGDGGAVVLAEILSGNTSVSGSGVVSDGTVGRPGVEQIFLAHCGIGNYGAASLGSALVLNPHMTNLVLIGNPVSVSIS